MRRRLLAAASTVTLLLVAVSCSGSSGSSADPGATDVATSDTEPEFPPMTEPLYCDPLDERACLLPWPNDGFTVPDPTTPTGRRLAIQPDSTPMNADGVAIDVTDQNRADGFSPGTSILVYVPGLDTEKTGIAPSTDIGASLAEDSPLVLLDTVTGERMAYWGELDAAAPAGDQVLVVHPARALPEGHHFVVALRHLLDATGTKIPPSSAFQAALDSRPEPMMRASAFFAMFDALQAHGVDPGDLYVAWDFTVASAENLSSRVLSMREQTYADLGDGAPAFRVTEATEAGATRTIEGTFDAPNYLTGDGSPGNRFALDADGMPQRSASNPVLSVPFRCVVPTAAPAAVPAIVYGHGLMGSRREVDGLGAIASAGGTAAACAIDEIGMSSEDIPNLATILTDLSHFPEQADRMQQGLLDQQLLGRLLNSAKGFVTDPAFQHADGSPIVANGQTQFVGNSQGGILGGAASAISTEWTRVVLGVPGIAYSLLLPRSSDWPQFAGMFEAAYADPADRLLAQQLMQLLWDRGENDGYAQHLTADPYPGIPAKQVLLVEAFGDHQVANVSTEILARTLGAVAHEPAIADGRSKDVDPLWGIDAWDPTATGPAALLMLWDYGTPAPPTVNLPPTEPEYGQDPHGAGSREPLVLQQALTFLLTGTFLDVCGASPCTSTVLTG